MTLETLPNELLIQCFKYFNAADLFYSFDQLNNRFNTLIRNDQLYFDFQNIEKTRFDQCCTIISSNTDIKKQIYSLKLSNKNTCQIHLFLSYFSLKEFSNLRSLTLVEVKEHNVPQLTLMFSSLSQLLHFHWIGSEWRFSGILITLPTFQLQTLTVPNLVWYDNLMCNISSIINLTLNSCDLNSLHVILNNAFNLKYFKAYVSEYEEFPVRPIDPPIIEHNAIYLKKLILMEFYDDFPSLKTILEHTPNLEDLTICAKREIDMIDANQWQNLITSSLPYLKIFKFCFEYYDYPNHNDFHRKFNQFQTNFWYKQHHWYTEYTLSQHYASIYTIPFISSKYYFISNTNICCLTNDNTFDNVTDLIIDPNALTDNSQCYFTHVTSMTLGYPLLNNSECVLNENHIIYLQNIVNLTNINNLCIGTNCKMKTSSILLNILKEASNISFISIYLSTLIPLLNDDELCKYLKMRIKKLDLLPNVYEEDIHNYRYFCLSYEIDDSLNDLYKINKFWEIFSNIEQFTCKIEKQDSLIFLLHHLKNLLRINISSSRTSSIKNLEKTYLEEEAYKLDIQMITDIESCDLIPSTIWIIRNIF